MICGSKDDILSTPTNCWGWQAWLKEGDRLWSCPQGRHFFHYYPQHVDDDSRSGNLYNGFSLFQPETFLSKKLLAFKYKFHLKGRPELSRFWFLRTTNERHVSAAADANGNFPGVEERK